MRDNSAGRYVNIWSAPGLLGSPLRGHASVAYATADEALVGRGVAPDPSFKLVGTLDIQHRLGPTFVSAATLGDSA